MLRIKKREYFVLLFLILAFLLAAVSIIAEDAWFNWYNPSNTICCDTCDNQGVTGGTQSFSSSFLAGCCNAVGWTQVQFCTSYSGCTSPINAEYCYCAHGSQQQQSCGNCGTQTRTCSGGDWGSWSSCTGQGVCSPGASRACGFCGTQSCTSSCAWGPCIGQGVCRPGSKQCSGTWLQTCSSSCTWVNTQNCDTDGCSGTVYRDYYCSASSCTFTALDSDTSVTYCNCLGAGYWSIGGEASGTTCCGDDTSEYRITEASSTDAPAGFSDGGTTCCDTLTDCTDNDNCVSNTGTRGSVPNKAYCSSSIWYGGDASSSACSAIVGAGYWQIGGEVAASNCCGDDTSEYRITEASSTDAPSPYNDNTGTTCCNPSTDCTESGTDTCTVTGSAAGTIPNKAYCGASNAWYGGDASSNACSAIVGANYWSLGGEIATTTCCGDDNGEYKTTQGIGTACCDKQTDCADRNNRCQDEYGKEETCEPWDGFDDDCDGLTDCSDPDCSLTSYCQGCESEICDNGKDDDCDRYIDCEDSDCLSVCTGCSTEICSGGTDEDCDGKIDCADNDCIGDPNCATCNNGGPATQEDCDDDKDNDCDTLIDDADWNCPGCPAGTALCNDGKTCDSWCASKTGGVQGCIAENGKCEEGEGCACNDCKNERDSCETGLVCDSAMQLCLCPSGTKICSDGACRTDCSTCGFGGIEPGEECDSVFPSGITKCEDIDSLKGTIGCTDCFITSCTDGPANCGDEIIQSGETCDGTNLDGKTCSSFGFDNGYVACFELGSAHQCHFDTSGCYDKACIDENNMCDAGEDCRCPDCLGEQATCGYSQVCDETASCKCEDGTTLCGDGTCRLAAECETLPGCKDGAANGICELGEGCDCPDCEGKTDTCASSSTCINGVCTACSILKAYWTEDCIGSGNKLKLVVEGSLSCEGKTVNLDLKEQDGGLLELIFKPDDDILSSSAVFKNGKAELEWVTEFEEEGTSPNECILSVCDAAKYSGNPPKDFLEYYFEARIGGETVISEVLNVHYCIPECDADCDTFVDADKQSDLACQALKNTDYPSKTGEENLKIDSNPKSGYCEDCTPDGLSPGQETCAAYYDCTPGWWKDTTPTGWNEQMKTDAMNYLEWDECGEPKGATGEGRAPVTDLIRNRLVCPPGLSEDECCKDQGSCYCEMPGAEAAGMNCDDVNFRPTEIKGCLAEEKFPFFTNMNILIVVLILTGFYIWKTRRD